LRFRETVVDSYTEIYTKESNEAGFANARDSFGKKWGWYQSIYALAKGNVLEIENVTKLPLFECLNYLSFEKEKIQIEQDEINKAYKR
tara:strand:- start:188 stop:451 length:264 start_codon:yes stop_codon:yes gene_type:complete